MAMFDIGRRGSGQESDLPQDELPETSPVAPTAQEWQAPGQGGVRRREAAVIGPSIHIDGTLKGEEDLLIEGRVTGTVQLQDHSLTIGAKGEVRADVYAHTVIVEGAVEGDLYGVERVAVRGTARVRGNITAPRVSLEDGAAFKGSIEMDGDAVAAAMGTRAAGSSTAQSTKAAATSSGSSGASAASSSGGGSASGSASRSESVGKAAKSDSGEQGQPSSTGERSASKGGAGGSGA